MKTIVTGANGQLGYDVVRELKQRGFNDVIGIDIKDLDITNETAVADFFVINKPDLIIHCAAYTAVDNAEDNQALCYKVNVLGTELLVNVAKKYNAKFVYISTDYVFDGEKKSSYEVDDIPNPKSIYGKSKYLGELETIKHDKYFIIRISWVFGKNGANFVKTMLRLANEKPFINVVNDQYGSPTYTYDLSNFIIDLIQTDDYGVYHTTNEGVCTWYDFAHEIFKQAHISTPIYPISSVKYTAKAYRPMNSVLSKTILDQKGFKRLPDWKNALNRFLKEIEVIK